MIDDITKKIAEYKDRLKEEEFQLYADYSIACLETSFLRHPAWESPTIGNKFEIVDPCNYLKGDDLENILVAKKITLKDLTFTIDDDDEDSGSKLLCITTGKTIPNPKYPEYLKAREAFYERRDSLNILIEELETKLAKKIASWELNNES